MQHIVLYRATVCPTYIYVPINWRTCKFEYDMHLIIYLNKYWNGIKYIDFAGKWVIFQNEFLDCFKKKIQLPW